MFKFDPKRIREMRQETNDDLCRLNLLDAKGLGGINVKALERYLTKENLTRETLSKECSKNPLYARAIASMLSIQASRQGSKDEDYVLKGIGDYVKQFGYQVESLSPKAARPIRGGGIAENVKVKDNEEEYLKSLDALIWRGDYCFAYVFAKVVVGVGGHQDNVKREALEFIEWAQKDSTVDHYVVLIDGEDYTTIKDYDSDRIWIVNHIELQKRLSVG